MNFKQLLTVFHPPSAESCITFEVRKDRIWGLGRDDSIIVFSNDDDVRKKYSFTRKEDSYPQMIVDPSGVQCMLFWPGAALIHFSLKDEKFTEILPGGGRFIQEGTSPTSGCWVERPGKQDIFVMGSVKGEVVFAIPEISMKFSYIHKMGSNARIDQIEVWRGQGPDDLILFMLQEGNIHVFSTDRGFELVFSGRTKALAVGAGGTTRKRLWITNDPRKCQFMGVLEGVLLDVKVTDNGKQLDLAQYFCEIPTDKAKCFYVADFCKFVARDKCVSCFWDKSVTCELPIPDVNSIQIQGDKVWFMQNGRMTTVMIANLKKYIFAEAMKKKHYDFAIILATDLKEKKEALNKVLPGKKSQAIKYIVDLGWPFETVMELLDPKSDKAMFYLKAILELIPPERKKQKETIIFWIFYLHTLFLPKYENEFREFLKSHAKVLGKTVYRRLLEIHRYDALVQLAIALEDFDSLILFLDSDGRIDELFKFLGKTQDNYLYAWIISKLLRNEARREQTKTHLLSMDGGEREYRASVLVPVLVQVPDIVSVFIGDNYLASPAISSLVVTSLFVTHNEGRLISLLLGGAIPASVLLGYAKIYDCKQVEARTLFEINQPEKAVDVAYKGNGWDYVQNMLVSVGSPDVQRRGYTRMLQIASPEDKVKTLHYLEMTELFEFGDLLDFVEDDTCVGGLSKALVTYVDSLEKSVERRNYKKLFPRVRREDFLIQVHDGCAVCGKHIMGRQFIRYPCTHLCHVECAQAYIRENVTTWDRMPDVTESCPKCGFLAVSFAVKEFDV